MVNRPKILILCLSSLALLSVAVSAAGARDAADYFTFRRGDMPLIVCAPHGGREDAPGIEERKSGLFKPDVDTDLVALGLTREIQRLTGKRPYLVVAKIKRSEIDFNRPVLPEHEPFGGWERAFRDNDAAKYWEFYHATIDAYEKEILGSSPDRLALLLDIHGHIRPHGTRGDLIFGDEYGASVGPLLQKYGTASIDGPCSIMGIMASKGYRVLADVPQFAGGYTVRVHSGPKTAAMLIEIPEIIRTAKRLRERFERDLGEAIISFLDCFPLGNPSSE